MATALERTLSCCNEIQTASRLHAIELKENSEKEGFAAGFQLFFTQLMMALDEYDKLQNQRFAKLQQDLGEALKNSFFDPVIVDRIICHLQEKIGQQKNLKIIIPRKVSLPKNIDESNYLFTDENSITVRDDYHAVRFPSETLCEKWLDEANLSMATSNNKINKLIPETLIRISDDLIKLAGNQQDSYPANNYYHEEKDGQS
ncbi:type III secretion protein [Erwinia psidii]|uniref:Type III secretion protein n=2 Tax=Erwinia psidii TaxID=69224 RepID=A0A3N6V1W6_9GAMM|nr:type III secretion protein [Erwinia psidii]MCX8961144.1 type III secretion protein [Erwinia psidii]MCX8966684.1 type III secretion protein [Erwinia psidii]RQM39055.1 type III secretion protein [Erwinia psidii]